MEYVGGRFNPRLPGGRRHSRADARYTVGVFQSTPSGGKATHSRVRWVDGGDVSIHAFRGEGDRAPFFSNEVQNGFNPRLPGGRRLLQSLGCALEIGFNPRLPGGRRPALASVTTPSINVSIHAFRGEGDDGGALWCMRRAVSIHAFRGEGDMGRMDGTSHLLRVSIHAFRGEGDPMDAWLALSDAVSIHAFRREGDRRFRRYGSAPPCFNPRLPGGRRRESESEWGKPEPVSIHAFRGEGDIIGWINELVGVWFQSTPSGGKATSASASLLKPFPFQSTPSGGKATRTLEQIAY